MYVPLCQIQMRDPVHYHTKKKPIMICLREGVCAPYHDFGCGVLILGIPGLKEFFVFFEMEECRLVGLCTNSGL